MMERDAGNGMRDACRGMLHAIALCCLLGMPAVAAESFPLGFRAPHDLPEQARSNLQTAAQKHADQMALHLNFHLRAVDRACGLSEEQRSKLELAAQGAVQDSLEEWLAPILAALGTGSGHERQSMMALFHRLNGGEGIFFQQGNGQPGEVRFVIWAVQDGQQMMIGDDVAQRSKRLKLDETAVLRHPIFVGALDSVLTDSQREKLVEVERVSRELREEDAQKRRADAERLRANQKDVLQQEIRRAFLNPGARQTERLVRQIGIRLALDEVQVQQVCELVEQIDVEQVVRWRAEPAGVSVKDAAEMTLPHLPKEKMREILTPGQFERWETIVEKAEQPTVDAPQQTEDDPVVEVAE